MVASHCGFRTPIQLKEKINPAKEVSVSYKLTRPLYTIKDVCDMLSYSRSTVVRRINASRLTTVSLGPNSVRITADSLMAYLSSIGVSSQMSSQP